MTQLGPGAVCCGDPTDCTIECGQKDLLIEQPTDVPTIVEVELVSNEEEEDDE